MYQSLSVKTAVKKGPYVEFLNYILKEDSYECSFSTFLDSVQRAITLPK